MARKKRGDRRLTTRRAAGGSLPGGFFYPLPTPRPLAAAIRRLLIYPYVFRDASENHRFASACAASSRPIKSYVLSESGMTR